MKTQGAERGLGLLLSLIQYASAAGVVSVSEAAEHFAVSEERIQEAIGRVFMSGVPDGVGDFVRFDIDVDALETQNLISVTMRPAFDDETVRLSPREASALIAGLTLVGDYTGATPERVAALQKKLRGAASKGAATVAVDAPAAPRHAQLIRDAIRQRRVLALTYRKPAATAATSDAKVRLVAPTTLEIRNGEVFVEGIDLGRNAMRTFRLDRIERVEPSDETWPDGSPERTRVLSGRATIVATRAAAALLGEYAASKPEAVSDERVRLDIDVWSEAAVLRAVAACGGDAEIVEPASLRDAMRQFALDALGASSEAAAEADAPRG